MHSDPVIDDAARAILDGAMPDWPGLESSDDLDTRALGDQLKVLSAVARVHRAEVTSPLRPERAHRLGRWGHLELQEQVGAGAFGDVYRAWDTRLDREVALKLLPAGRGLRTGPSPILQEGRLLARVRHPNVATIYGAELIDGRVGLWMEFIKGRTLEEQLRSGHRFGIADVVHIGVELCRAVSAVHAAGLLHRDIKAQNVMRGDDGRVVLMDFGTGREHSDAGASVAGTPLYLAPEIFRGRPATAQSDVYSVGVVLYHLLTGAYPVTAATIDDLRRAHARGDRADLQSARPDVPAALASVIARALSADPARRYPACDALGADLRAVTTPSHRSTVWRGIGAGLLAASVGLSVWVGSDVRAASAGANDGGGIVRAGIGFVAGAGAPAVDRAERPVIAVLPFENRGAAPDSDLFADGLTHELIRSLGTVEGLDVKSANASFALKGQDLDVAAIGRRLHVNLVLTGTLLVSGDQWRVYAQLARVGADTPIWSQRFDRDGTDVFAIHDDIAAAVVKNLLLTLGTGQRRYTNDQDTYATYLKARLIVDRRGMTSAADALPMFEQVIARDPTYAPAFAGLAEAYAIGSMTLPDIGGMEPARALGLMRSAARRALDLDPFLAEAHAAMGYVHSREHDWDEADASFRRALQLNPNLTHVYSGYSFTTLRATGRYEEAEAVLREALRRDPGSLTAARDLAEVWINAGRYDDAIRALQGLAAADPDLPFVPMSLARALTFAGRVEEALPIWDSRNDVGWQHWTALAYVKAGRRAEVEAMAATHKHPYRLAVIHAALGHTDRALDALERAADEVPDRVVWLLGYPEMAAFRGHPRFEALRARFHLR